MREAAILVLPRAVRARRETPMPEELCPICEGAGLRLVERADGTRVAVPCDCRIARRSTRMIEQARIPERYRHCTLDDFAPNYDGKNKSLEGALLMANDYVQSFPTVSDGKGLVLLGTVGLGKTHLAVGILRGLITKWGVKGLFCDYRDLLKRIQDSYGRNDVSERQVLAPVFDAEVLVIDELGAAKPTEWVWDTVQHILNTRYNDRKTTIITTNYPNLPETRREEIEGMSDAQKSMREQTLGDRITERMRSRLHEMCVMIEMSGRDFRKSKPGRASFANRKYTAAELFTLSTPDKETPEAKPEIGGSGNVHVSKHASGQLRSGDKTEKPMAAERNSSLISPEKVWTQADIDREVALKTALKAKKLDGY